MKNEVGIKTNGRYEYMSAEDSDAYDKAVAEGNQQVIELLIRLRNDSKSAHAACRY